MAGEILADLLKIIDEKKTQLDAYRPLPSEIVKNLDQWFSIEQIYNSNALEGNTLTRRETALVVEKGWTIGGKSVQEHLEVINYGIALDFIKELAVKNRDKITLSDILDVHRLVLKGIDENNTGCLRTVQVFIAGSDVQLPNPLKVSEYMQTFIAWLNTVDKHPVEVAAEAHFKLVAIHPFVDGNGRTARLLMNLLLLQAGYVPAIIEVKKRLDYINAIVSAEIEDNFSDFYALIFHAEIKSLDKYLQVCRT